MADMADAVMNVAAAMNRAVVIVDRKVGQSSTTYTLTGHMDAVRSKVESLFREWPKDGYGSSFRMTDTGAVFERFNSCD